MKKYYTIIGIASVFLLVAGFMYFSLGGTSRDIQKVISNDGFAELAIPRNALPEGMSIKDISITNVSAGDADERGPIVSYRLEPDGLVFDENVFFTTTLDNVDGAVPILLHKTSDGKADLVGNLEVDIDLENNKTTITAPLAHFSSLDIYSGSAHSFFQTNIKFFPQRVFVEDVVNARATVEKKAENHQLALRIMQGLEFISADRRYVYRNYRLVSGAPVGITGKVGADYYIFAPDQEFTERPAPTTFTENTYEITSNDFRCEKPGFGGIDFTVILSWEVEGAEGSADEFGRIKGKWTTVPGYNKKSTDKLNVHGLVECVARSSVLDKSGTSVIESEAKAIGDILEVASADPARVECPGADYLSPDRGGISVDVFKLKDGKCYPVRQFGNSSPPDKCAESHYHTQLTSLDGTVRNDSQPCGAAVQSDIIKSGAIYVSPAHNE